MLSFVAGIRIPASSSTPRPRVIFRIEHHFTKIANERWLSSTTPSNWTNLFDRLGNMKIILVIFLNSVIGMLLLSFNRSIRSLFTLRFLAPFFSLEQSKYPTQTRAQTHTCITHIHTVHERDFFLYPLFAAASAITAAANDIFFNQLVWNFGRVSEGGLVLIFLVLSRHLYIHRKVLVFQLLPANSGSSSVPVIYTLIPITKRSVELRHTGWWGQGYDRKNLMRRFGFITAHSFSSC